MWNCALFLSGVRRKWRKQRTEISVQSEEIFALLHAAEDIQIQFRDCVDRFCSEGRLVCRHYELSLGSCSFLERRKVLYGRYQTPLTSAALHDL